MGNVCNETCPDHCGDCNQSGYKCNSCENGWFGVNCELNCGRCGGNGSCNITTGDCHLCSVGILETRAIRNVTNFVTQVNHVTRLLENVRTVDLVDMENIVQNFVAELVKT